MAPARRWNLADFALVLDAPATPAADLAVQVPRRSRTEIEQLRVAVHATHRPWAERRDLPPILTDPMSRYLSRRRGTLTCAVCGAHF